MTVSSWCGVDNPAQKFESSEHEIRPIKQHPKGNSASYMPYCSKIAKSSIITVDRICTNLLS